MCAIRLFGVLWFSKFGAWQNLNACLVSQTFQTQDNNFRQIGHPNTQFNVDTHKLVAHKWKNCLVDLERQEYLFHASRLSFDWTAEEGMRTSSTAIHALAVAGRRSMREFLHCH
jgi:hypothetical protein